MSAADLLPYLQTIATAVIGFFLVRYVRQVDSWQKESKQDHEKQTSALAEVRQQVDDVEKEALKRDATLSERFVSRGERAEDIRRWDRIEAKIDDLIKHRP